MNRWLRFLREQFFGGNRNGPSRKRSHRARICRPSLEHLEQRLVPAVVLTQPTPNNYLLNDDGVAPVNNQVTLDIFAGVVRYQADGGGFINIASAGTIASLVVTLQGGNDSLTLADSWTFPAFATPSPNFAYDGGTGVNSLSGNNAGNDYAITGSDTGTLNKGGNPLTFSNVSSLAAGNGDDKFVFAIGGSVSGDIDGNGGKDVLDFHALASQSITLTAVGAIDGFNGFTPGITPIGGTFFEIDGVIGSTAGNTDSLTGINAVSTWTIGAPNAGTYASGINSFTFANVESLTGGSAADTFTFANGGSLTGNINGAGSLLDTIKGDDGGRTFTLTGANSGTISTILGGTFSNVENLTGGSGRDNFVFQAAGSLTGNIDDNTATSPPTPVSPNVAPAVTDVTAQVVVSVGRARFNRATGRTRLRVLLHNAGPTLPGPVSFVLDGLTKGVRLRRAAGRTVRFAPLRSPFAELPLGPSNLIAVSPAVPPGPEASLTVQGGAAGLFVEGETRYLDLVFVNPTGGRFRFHFRILAGSGTP